METPVARVVSPRVPGPPLMDVALAHRSLAVLFAAAELDVFTVLAEGPKTAADVARACGREGFPDADAA
jgi:hypothetical protein